MLNNTPCYLDSWQRHGLLIAPEALRLIDRQREALRRLSAAELELLIRSALAAEVYRPGPYQSFFIHEPKLLPISAAPFRDRVVHHASSIQPTAC